MRGRKRQRKKNKRRRGVWGLPVYVIAKRPSEQPLADMLAEFISSKISIERIAERAIADSAIWYANP